MSSSNKSKAISGAYWMGLTTIINLIVKLLVMVVLSRLLMPNEFGVVAAVQIIISFADIFWKMGVGPALVQKKKIYESDLVTGNILNILFGFFVYILILITAPILGPLVGIEEINMIRVLAIVFLVSSISSVSESILQREMDFKNIGLINMLTLTLYGATSIILAILGFGAWALIYAQIIQVVVAAILYLIKKPIKISYKIDMNAAKNLLNFGVGFTISRFLNTIANQGDNFVISRVLGITALGYYNRAYQLLMVPTSIVGTINDKVLFPLLSKYQDNNDKLKYVYLNLSALIALISIPIVFIVLVSGTELVIIILGEQWRPVATPFKLLILSLFFRIAYKMCDTMAYSIGAVYKRVWTQLFYALTVIIGAYIGSNWGITGVAISTTIAILLNYLIMNLLIIRIIQLKLFTSVKYLFSVFLTNIILGSSGFLVNQIITDFPILLKVIIILTYYLILYLIVYGIFSKFILPKDFYNFIKSIYSSIYEKVVIKFQR